MANFLFVLGKDDNESATRSFQFAKIAHSKVHHVDMFFIDGPFLKFVWSTGLTRYQNFFWFLK